jgi:uncharacterized membrane protein YgcG
LLSRRTLFWTAWILLAASALLPAPAGSFVGDASGISGFYVLGKVIAWSRAAPGSDASLDFGRVVVITLAAFANVAFLFAFILRDRRDVSAAYKVFLVASAVVGGSVAFLFPEFARLPGYWLWLASLAVLACAFILFPGQGVAAKAHAKRASATAAADRDTGDVPALLWVCLGFTVFWLAVTGIGRMQPTAPDASVDVPAAAALTTYFNDRANLVSSDMDVRLNDALANFERQTSNQIAVAIYPRAPQGAIETFTIATADQSRLGRKGLDNGAILFVFVAERSARLEVGYGLEGVLTDVDAHRVLEAHLVPAFAKADYAEGLDTTLGAIFVAIQDAYKSDRMPGKATVFWRQLRVEIPKLLQQAWPALSGFGLDARIGIAFFGGLLGLGIWDGFRQFGRLVSNLARGARNLAARRPFNTGMESVGLGSVIDTVKVIAIALAFIAGAAGLVIVATGGAFGGAGALVRW